MLPVSLVSVFGKANHLPILSLLPLLLVWASLEASLNRSFRVSKKSGTLSPILVTFAKLWQIYLILFQHCMQFYLMKHVKQHFRCGMFSLVLDVLLFLDGPIFLIFGSNVIFLFYYSLFHLLVYFSVSPGDKRVDRWTKVRP